VKENLEILICNKSFSDLARRVNREMPRSLAQLADGDSEQEQYLRHFVGSQFASFKSQERPAPIELRIKLISTPTPVIKPVS
jgi:hypothetical protein